MNVSDAISIVVQILNGLKALHLNKIIHRYLGTNNIFMVDGVAKLGELGICKDLTNQILPILDPT